MGKKQKRFILILVGLFFLTGCSESRIRDILEETERGMSGQPLAEGAVNVGIMAREGKYYDLEKEENPYFFPDGMIQKEYEGYFVPPSNNEIR